jgi:L-alanine-DL-glutamate epimerase-like enolase superfamily enzyme
VAADDPIAPGKCAFTRSDFAELLERRALDIAQPNVARAGGMTEIRRVVALASAYRVRLAPQLEAAVCYSQGPPRGDGDTELPHSGGQAGLHAKIVGPV